MKKCTYCGSENDNNAIYCHSCGKRFDDAKSGQMEFDPSSFSQNQKTCPACEAPIKSTDTFCSNCGFNIKEFEDKLKNLAKTRKLEKITPPKPTTAVSKKTEKPNDSVANQETVSLSNNDVSPDKKEDTSKQTTKDEEINKKPADSEDKTSQTEAAQDKDKTMVIPVPINANKESVKEPTSTQESKDIRDTQSSTSENKSKQIPMDPAIPVEPEENEGEPKQENTTKSTNAPVNNKQQQISNTSQPYDFSNEDKLDKEYLRSKWMKGIGFLALIIVFIGIIAFAGFSFLKQQNSKETQINDFLTLVSKKNASELVKTVKTTDDALELTEDNILPLINYLDGNANTTKTIKDELVKSNKADDYSISLKKNGKQGLFFDHYDIYITPVYYTALTNKIGTKVSLNGENTFTTTKEPETTTIGPLVPGTYKLLATYKPEDSDEVSLEKTVDLVKTDRSNPIDLEFVSVAFTVRSNVDEADVYISGEKVGTLENGSYKVESRLWNEDMTIQLKKELDSGTITTSEEKINKDLYNTTKNDPTMTLNFDEASVGKIDDSSTDSSGTDTNSSTASSGAAGSGSTGISGNVGGTTNAAGSTSSSSAATNNGAATGNGNTTTGSSTNTSSDATTQESPVIATPSVSGTAVNQATMNTVANSLNSVYNEFSNLALIQNSYSKEAFANAYFGGNQSNPVFVSMNDYLTWVRYRQTINDFQSVRFDLLILNVYDLGNNNYRVNYDITYNTYYPDGRSVRVQTFRYSDARMTVSPSGQIIFTSMGDGGVKIYDNY